MRLATHLYPLVPVLVLAATVRGAQADASTASALPATTVQIGRPATTVRVALDDTTETSVLKIGATQITLDAPGARELRAQSVRLRDGSNVGIVRVRSDAREVAALVVRKGKATDVIWTGRIDLHGDPGERHADALELEDRDGDGHVDVMVGTYDERVRVCGQARTLLGARALDVHTLGLRPYAEGAAGLVDGAQVVTASSRSPGAAPTPLLRALRTTVAAGSDGSSVGNAALMDGDLTTALPGGDGALGAARFLNLRWDAARTPIRALSFAFARDSGAPQAAEAAPSLALVGDQAERLSIVWPGPVEPGVRYWVVPPKPLASSCISLLAPPSMGSAVLSELQAYTEHDFEGGLAELIADLRRDGRAGADAALQLSFVGPELWEPLLLAFPKQDSQGKRRVLRALRWRIAQEPRALELLQLALGDDDLEVRATALQVGIPALPAAAPALLTAASRAGATGDQAALAVAAGLPVEASTRLLELLAQGDNASRPALREAIGLCVARGGEAAVSRVQAWLAANRSGTPAALAAAALALSAVEAGRPLAAQVIDQAHGSTQEFPDLFRLMRAASALPAESTIDAWLARLSSDEKSPWMVRAEALSALASRRSAQADPSARAALADSYPRVRSAALTVLSEASDSVELLSETIRKDKWFSVRSAALSLLPKAAGAELPMLAALDDRAAVVRATAIHSLARVGHAQGWKRIQPRVDNPEEYPEVIGAGIDFAKALCVQSAVPSLQAVFTRGLKPNAWTRDQELGLAALDALTALGGDAARWAAQQSKHPLVPEPMKRSAEAAVREKRACAPSL